MGATCSPWGSCAEPGHRPCNNGGGNQSCGSSCCRCNLCSQSACCPAHSCCPPSSSSSSSCCDVQPWRWCHPYPYVKLVSDSTFSIIYGKRGKDLCNPASDMRLSRCPGCVNNIP